MVNINIHVLYIQFCWFEDSEADSWRMGRFRGLKPLWQRPDDCLSWSIAFHPGWGSRGGVWHSSTVKRGTALWTAGVLWTCQDCRKFEEAAKEGPKAGKMVVHIYINISQEFNFTGPLVFKNKHFVKQTQACRMMAWLVYSSSVFFVALWPILTPEKFGAKGVIFMSKIKNFTTIYHTLPPSFGVAADQDLSFWVFAEA